MISTIETLDETVASLEQWRSEEGAKHNAELAEAEQEMDSLRKAVTNLEEQIKALEEFKSEVESRASSLPGRAISRGNDAIFSALATQSEALAARAALVSAAEAERSAALPAALAESDVGELVTEYRQFKEQVEPTLAALPESYRSVILTHHEGVANKLQDHLASRLAAPVQIEGDALEVQVAFAIDAYEGVPELLVVVVPVSEATHSDWQNRDEDLQTWLAARVAQAVYQAAKASGQPVHPATGGHRGLLAFELDLLQAPPGLVDSFREHLVVVLGSAPEFKGAKIKVAATEVPIDFLVPPEDEHTDSGVSTVAVSGGQEAADAG